MSRAGGYTKLFLQPLRCATPVMCVLTRNALLEYLFFLDEEHSGQTVNDCCMYVALSLLTVCVLVIFSLSMESAVTPL